MIYGYIRTSRAAVDGLAGMHPETQVQALAGAGVELAHIVCGVGITSLAPAESWLEPRGAHPTEVEQMMGEIILRVMAWAAQADLDSIKRRIEAGVRRAAEEGRFPGRPRALTPDQTAAIRLLRRNGQSQSAVARTFGVSRQTVWRAEQPE